MGNVFVEEQNLRDIADAIREKNGGTDTYKPSEMADAIRDIEVGGGDSHYDTFWDIYQDYGKRTVYTYGFGYEWSDQIFKPKYDITPTNSMAMFIQTDMTDLVKILEKQGVTIDFSKTTTLRDMCYQCKELTTFPVVDITSIPTNATYNMYQAFISCTSLKELHFKGVKSGHIFYNTFNNCDGLEKLIIEGTIGKDINLQWSSLLEVESAKNIIRCLENIIETKPFANTITFHEDVWMLLKAEGNTSPNNNLWEDYVMDLGWNKG